MRATGRYEEREERGDRKATRGGKARKSAATGGHAAESGSYRLRYGLALVSFFALLDLVQFAAAYVIITTNDSPVSSRYALATVRNFFCWLAALSWWAS